MALDNEHIKAVEAASGHSIFGSSSLPRILDCPASVGEELKMGLRPASIYAAKGTELHSWTEKSLNATRPRDYILAQDLTIEDTALVLDAIDYVFEVMAKHPEGATIKLESEGNLASYGLPEVYGTMDVIIESENRIDVIDHKFGFGVAVYAKKNIQLVSYLAMAVPYISVPDHDKELYIHINQPPLNIFDEWRVSWDDLYQMILGDVTDAIGKARSDDPPFGPSVKACRFCKSNMKCKARYNALKEQAGLVQQLSKNPAGISNDQWATFMEAGAALKAAISNVESYAVSEIQGGRDFPGFKLVSGRANRKFVDEEAGHKYLEQRLGSKAKHPAKFISLAQAEKIDKSLKKDDDFNSLIYKPQGKAKLVKAEAPGKALVYGTQGLMNEMAQGKA